ncbi:putative signal peptide protein [Puccinia sorghi]|uniref:Putative signal peptide protein n=1 Tax=Puccinia sorghi TaxID=27349 RepID=A0A0L6UZV8_9BASI|nr:putative signal peptide protein [Puccinia sorghi]
MHFVLNSVLLSTLAPLWLYLLSLFTSASKRSVKTNFQFLFMVDLIHCILRLNNQYIKLKPLVFVELASLLYSLNLGAVGCTFPCC